MPKFKKEKKVIRKQVGGYPTGAVQQRGTGRGSALPSFDLPFGYPTGAVPGGARGVVVAPSQPPPVLSEYGPDRTGEGAEYYPSIVEPKSSARPKKTVASGRAKATQARPTPPMVEPVMPVISMAPAVDPLASLPSRQLPSMTRGVRFDMPEGEQQELESMMKSSGATGIAGEIPKTKAGLKKFMQEYGKFIALGAMAGQGGRGGQIAAPIMAALPGLIEMMKGKKKGESMKKADGGSIKDSKKNLLEKARTGDTDDSKSAKFIEKRSYTLDGPRRSSTFLDALFAPRVPDLKDVPYYKDKYPKSSGGEPPKKSEGGAIRKFKGGSMKGNSMDSMLTPKYAKGGKTDKMGKMGKAAGEMPQHKKMAMGKPTPQSTGQKFAKGGAAKYAGGGMCKGYGISKKIRPTGPMN